ncbi:hypothetical protein [Cardinium endosymbiont of Nabis limbatus]|uniref:hypothetical protein n=1 Tax=Cardinium endosymbiont of Nabis limbatus TaxID=3066217 RepID=UPI003AF391D7
METHKGNALSTYGQEVLQQVSIQLKYESYFLKEKELVEKMERLEYYIIPPDFDYTKIKALSTEALEKLQKKRPTTLEQASRISGACKLFCVSAVF